jgi:predicted anti-sigma-YlaC factor YlaD
MTDCSSIKDLIGAWLDGELEQSTAEAVRAHVETCSACEEEQRQLEKLQIVLKSVLAAEASRVALRPFWSGVQRRITAKRSWREGLFGRVREADASPRLAWAVPAVILLLLGVLSVDSWLANLRLLGPRNNFASVELIDAHGRNVALLREDETKTTVIWLYQNQEGEDEPTGEGVETTPSF